MASKTPSVTRHLWIADLELMGHELRSRSASAHGAGPLTQKGPTGLGPMRPLTIRMLTSGGELASGQLILALGGLGALILEPILILVTVHLDGTTVGEGCDVGLCCALLAPLLLSAVCLIL